MTATLKPTAASSPQAIATTHGGWVVRLYGDSLGLPRHADGLAWSDTYGERFCHWLRRHTGTGVSFYNRSQGGATAPLLARLGSEDNTYFGPSTPQLLVWQCGICDCAPRPVPLLVRHLIGRLPGPLQRQTVGFIHRARPWLQRHGCVWRHTNPTQFKAVVTDWVRQVGVWARGVLVFNVAPPTEAGENHSPGLMASVATYNKLLAAAVLAAQAPHVLLVDAHAALSVNAGTLARCINQQDGHHLTAAGHQLYAELLQQNFEQLPRERLIIE